MKRVLTIYLICFVLFSTLLVGEELVAYKTELVHNVTIDRQNSKEVELNRVALLLIDSTNTAQMHDVRRLLPIRGKQVNGQVNFGICPYTFWYAFTIYNNDSVALSRLFVIGDYFLEEIDTYLLSNDSLYSNLKGGCVVPFSQREILNRYTIHRINLQPHETLQVMVKVKTRLTMSVPLKLWQEDAFRYSDSLSQIPMWLYYGIALGLFAYNLFIWLTLRSKTYFLYLLYILHISAFLFWGSNGLGFQFFSLSVEFSFRLIMYLGIMSMALVSFLTIAFLDLPSVLPRWNTVVTICARLLMVLALSAWFLPIPLVRDVGNPATGLLAILCGAVAVRSLWLGYTPAKYFAAGWVVFLFVTVLFVMQDEGIIEWYFIGQYGAQFGSAFEMILFSIALASRIRVLEKERVEAREELLYTSQALILSLQESEKTLELKVAERTKNLQEANERLNVQSQQIQLVNSILQEQNLALDDSRSQIERLMLNILPKAIFVRLQAGEKRIADKIESATVLFADIVNFTEISSKTPPVEIVAILDTLFSKFDELAEKYNVEKIKTIGDAYMVVGGLADSEKSHSHAIALLAIEMQQCLAETALSLGIPEVSLRIGIHTGEVVAGVIGTKKFAYDLWGDTVNTASRMESHGEPGKIHISESVFQALHRTSNFVDSDINLNVALAQEKKMRSGDQSFDFQERGLVDVKGKGAMKTWFLLGVKENS